MEEKETINVEFEEVKKEESMKDKVVSFVDNHKNTCLVAISAVSAIIKIIVDACGKHSDSNEKVIIHYDNPDPAMTMNNREFRHYLKRKKKEDKVLN